MLDAWADVQDIAVELPEAFQDLWRKIRYKAYWGGRGGAKSHSFAAVLVVMAFEGVADERFPAKDGEDQRMRGLRILCCREIQNSIEDSVKQLLEDQIERLGLRWFFVSTKREIRGLNGSRFLFEGLLRNVSKIKSKEAIDIVWVEEANTVSTNSLTKLVPTIRKPGSELWFSWNPDSPKDAVDKLLRGEEPNEPDPLLMGEYEEWQVVKRVNFRDNPWFPDVLRIEMQTDLKRDRDKYAHVWLGKYQQKSEARVFHNWRVGTVEEFASVRPSRFYYGADWGYARDPSTLVRCFIIDRTLYVDQEAYAVGCDVDHTPFLFGGCEDADLVQKNLQGWASLPIQYKRSWKGVPGARAWPVRADSARPETISYMQRHGFPKMVPATKGPGSVEDGITHLQSYDIVVHPDCAHTIDELSGYSWKVDKKTEEILPQLEDTKNHIIDPLRYAVELVRRAGVSVVAARGNY